jgi:hypothetical protein
MEKLYERGGVEALVDRSRAPHSDPHAVAPEVVQLMVTARKKHPTWGPQKLLVVVKRHHPRVVLPVASTVGELGGCADDSSANMATTDSSPMGRVAFRPNPLRERGRRAGLACPPLRVANPLSCAPSWARRARARPAPRTSAYQTNGPNDSSRTVGHGHGHVYGHAISSDTP